MVAAAGDFVYAKFSEVNVMNYSTFFHHKRQSLSSYLVAPEDAFCAFSLASSQNRIPFLTSFCFSFFLSFFPYFSNKI